MHYQGSKRARDEHAWHVRTPLHAPRLARSSAFPGSGEFRLPGVINISLETSGIGTRLACAASSSCVARRVRAWRGVRIGARGSARHERIGSIREDRLERIGSTPVAPPCTNSVGVLRAPFI